MMPQRESMTMKTRLLLLLAAMIVSTSLAVAENSDAKNQSDNNTQQGDGKEKATASNKTKVNPPGKKTHKPSSSTPSKPKVFIPTEEISEDLPVSFPVDI